MIQAYAAVGLAKVRDKDSIPLIVQACERAAPEMVDWIGQNGLALFDDPQAQSAVKRFAAAHECSKGASVQPKQQ